MAFTRKFVTDDEISAYVRRSQEGPCFVCQVVAGEADYKHHIIFQSDDAIVFLNMTQPVYGYTLVAPKRHKEQVVSDFSPDEYAALQELIHSVGLAVQQSVNPERLYLLSLGSQQGNSHVHWYVVPLPPEVPYEQQQATLLQPGFGVLDMTEAEKAEVAARIAEQLNSILSAAG